MGLAGWSSSRISLRILRDSNANIEKSHFSRLETLLRFTIPAGWNSEESEGIGWKQNIVGANTAGIRRKEFQPAELRVKIFSRLESTEIG